MSYRIVVPPSASKSVKEIFISTDLTTPLDSVRNISIPTIALNYILKELNELPETSITTMDLINLWNEFAVKYKWVKNQRQSAKLLKDIGKATKSLGNKADWVGILTAMAGHDYFGGSRFKPSIKILFSNERYMEFYDLYMAKQEGVLDRSIDDIFADLEAQTSTITIESLGLC